MTNTVRFETADAVLVERPYAKLCPQLKYAIECYRDAVYTLHTRERQLKAAMHNEGLDAVTDIPGFSGILAYSHATNELKSVRSPKPNGGKIPA
jgi:hypothetical protein